MDKKIKHALHTKPLISKINKTKSLMSMTEGALNNKILRKLKKGTKIALFWSGGKDSMLLLHEAKKQGLDIKYLITLVNNGLSISPPFNKELIKKQANSLELPIIFFDIKNNKSNMIKLFNILRKKGIYVLGVSYIDIKGQRTFLYNRAGKDFKLFEPHCNMNRSRLIKKVFNEKIKAIIVGVNKNVDTKWLGTRLDLNFITYVSKNKLDLCGENDEYQTFVYSSKYFKRNLTLKNKILLNDKNFNYLFIS